MNLVFDTTFCWTVSVLFSLYPISLILEFGYCFQACGFCFAC